MSSSDDTKGDDSSSPFLFEMRTQSAISSNDTTIRDPCNGHYLIDDGHRLTALMRSCYSDLFNYGKKFTGNESLIKNCIQEVFMNLWCRRHTANTIKKDIISGEINTEKHQRLPAMPANLSNREKEAIHLKYYRQMDNAQISELISISHGSAYNLVHSSIIKRGACWQHASVAMQ